LGKMVGEWEGEVTDWVWLMRLHAPPRTAAMFGGRTILEDSVDEERQN
jgi:hypothetical protein